MDKNVLAAVRKSRKLQFPRKGEIFIEVIFGRNYLAASILHKYLAANREISEASEAKSNFPRKGDVLEAIYLGDRKLPNIRSHT